MKFLLACFALVLATTISYAQDKPLPYDERGKLIYYEVVESAKTSKDSLMSRAKAFLDSNTKRFTVSPMSSDTALQAKGKMMISKSALGMARPMGAVDYQFHAEFKQGKYRFWLTDFVFIPYMRDRYGNFVPETSIGVPLEREQGKLRAAEWLGYQKITARESKALAEQFKIALATRLYPSESPKPKNTISTKKW
ncbi:MAG: DUF4468 domain-containing protein [Pedobacter sp.]|nr:MAG: DUF4468 domain-containing protein [Pedobacter sp.]